jgi:hypothetical protein
MSALARLRRMDGWRWEWAGAQRHGAPAFVDPSRWAASTWCSVLVADGETQLSVGAQLYPKDPMGRMGENEVRRARRSLRE